MTQLKQSRNIRIVVFEGLLNRPGSQDNEGNKYPKHKVKIPYAKAAEYIRDSHLLGFTRLEIIDTIGITEESVKELKQLLINKNIKPKTDKERIAELEAIVLELANDKKTEKKVTEASEELITLREEYFNLSGKKAHHKSSEAKLQEMIDELKEE